MQLTDLLSLSTRMFKTRPMRTFLTVLGVGVGIGAVLFLVSLGYGLQQVILHRIASADALLTLDVSGGPAQIPALNEESIASIRNTPHVQDISRQKNFPAQVTLDQLTGNLQLSAVDLSMLRLKGVEPIAGSSPEEGGPRGVIISSAGAKLFNLEPEQIVGRQMHLTILLAQKDESTVNAVRQKEPFIVTGVVEDENVGYIYVPFASLQDVEFTTVDQLKVRVESNSHMTGVRDVLLARGFIVSALSDTIEQANKIFRVVQIVLGLFGLVALFVSAIGMFNTMTITLLERTNEIGIMRAIGIRRRDIQKIFLVESMLMGFLGGVGGVLIGIVSAVVANAGINVLANRFGGTSLQLFVIPVWFVIVILAFSTVIGFLTGLYPSRRASHLNPLDALRYK